MSILPPEVRTTLAGLSEGDRRMLAQQYKGSYEVAMLNSAVVAAKMADKYTAGQIKHYNKVIAALDCIIGA